MLRKFIGFIYLAISGYIAFKILELMFTWIFVSGWAPNMEISLLGYVICLIATLALARVSLKSYPSGMPKQSLVMIIVPIVVIAPLAILVFMPFLSF